MNSHFKYHLVKLMSYLAFLLMFMQLLYVNDCHAQVNRKALNASLDYDNGVANLSITNNGDDTIYLFSSYLDEEKSRLKYLYRINNACDTVTISFLPIIPYLRTYPYLGCRIILDEDGESRDLIRAVYRFTAIAPKHTENVVIHTQDIFNKTSYIRASEFNLKKMHFIYFMDLPKPIVVEPDDKRFYVFEFALYSDIKEITTYNLMNKGRTFDKAVKNYCILKILYGRNEN